jgi:hypothetical protein
MGREWDTSEPLPRPMSAPDPSIPFGLHGLGDGWGIRFPTYSAREISMSRQGLRREEAASLAIRTLQRGSVERRRGASGRTSRRKMVGALAIVGVAVMPQAAHVQQTTEPAGSGAVSDGGPSPLPSRSSCNCPVTCPNPSVCLPASTSCGATQSYSFGDCSAPIDLYMCTQAGWTFISSTGRRPCNY